jgi:hypothetical protein
VINTRVSTAVAALFAILLLLLVGFGTYPTVSRYESQYTSYAHDSHFLDAIGSVQNTGIPGSVIALNPQVQKWVDALTLRTAYTPYRVAEFEFVLGSILSQEVTAFAVNSQYVSTNSLVYTRVTGLQAGALNGTNQSIFDGAPVYGTFSAGLAQDILRVNPFNITVGLNNQPVVQPAYQANITAVSVRFPNPSLPELTIVLANPGFNVMVSITEDSSLPTATITVSAVATSSALLKSLSATVSSPTTRIGTATGIPGTLPSFIWSTFGLGGTLNTTVVVTSPGGNLTIGSGPSPVGVRGTHAVISTPRNQTALNALVLSLSLNSPYSSNLIQNLPPTLSLPDWVTANGVRFVFLSKQPGGQPAQIPFGFTLAYFEAEYGAVPLFLPSLNPEYLVLELPSRV